MSGERLSNAGIVAAVPDVHVQVIASGADREAVAAVTADVVVCADGGVDVAVEAGCSVDLVIGDMDSASSEALAAVAPTAVVQRADVDKNETDLELALTAAGERGATHITVHLADGGRLDHQFANIAVLASPRWVPARIDAHIGTGRAWVVRGDRELPVPVGAPFALLPMGGSARVTSTGVRWPLDDEWLDATGARGISNEVVATPVRVQVAEGVVLAVSSAQAT